MRFVAPVRRTLLVLITVTSAGCGSDKIATPKPAGPVRPIPAGLWQPDNAPPTGNYILLRSEAGDYIGAGNTYSYFDPIDVASSGGHLTVARLGWSGDFQTMNTLDHIEQGYYPDLHRYPMHDPAKGGLYWWGHARECDTVAGWFAIDQVTYAGGAITSVDLRFEQHCNGDAPALHGVVHWDA